MIGLQTIREILTPVVEVGDFLPPELEDPESYIEAGDIIGFESASGKRYEGTVRRYDSDRDTVVFEYYHPAIKAYVRGEKAPADLYLILKATAA
jgi:hypothetical protein